MPEYVQGLAGLQAAQAAEGSAPAPVPAAVVLEKMKAFEDHYNADETGKSAAFYADACDVTVNEGSVFAGKTPEEVAGFLATLRNTLGGTNIKFSTYSVEGNVHKDRWVADNGAGACEATWKEVEGKWKMVKDDIGFTPKAGGDNETGVPTEVVLKAMQAFEDSYNADEAGKSAELYAAECDVKVNEGSVFEGKTPAEAAKFLSSLRNDLGGTNIKFAVTQVKDLVSEDVWVADNGWGACTATWAEVDGQWKIVKDLISFTPKVAA